MKKLLILQFLLLTIACSIFSPPPVIPQFDENMIVGPGTFADSELQWSFDGKFLAFVDDSGDFSRLGFYDINKDKHWLLSGIWTTKIAWHPSGRMSYMNYVSNANHSTYPLHYDLHIVDIDGENDEIVVSGLMGGIHDYIWCRNGTDILLIKDDAESPYTSHLYLLNTSSGQMREFIGLEVLDGNQPITVSLSPDETNLLIWTDNPCEAGPGDCIALVIYDMQTKQVTNRILSSEITTLTLDQLGMYSENAGWINNQWIVTKGSAILPSGEPFSSIVFLNPEDTSESFEIEVKNAFGGPTISPDLAYIAYINYNRGPHTHFITISKTPENLLSKFGETFK